MNEPVFVGIDDFKGQLDKLFELQESCNEAMERMAAASKTAPTPQAEELVGRVIAGTMVFGEAAGNVMNIAIRLEDCIREMLSAVELSPELFNLSEQRSVFLSQGDDSHPDMEYGRSVDSLMQDNDLPGELEEPDYHIGTPDSPESDEDDNG